MDSSDNTANILTELFKTPPVYSNKKNNNDTDLVLPLLLEITLNKSDKHCNNMLSLSKWKTKFVILQICSDQGAQSWLVQKMGQNK